jgi:hypothetical protein
MAECVAHKFHSPRPQTLDTHHVHPIGMGGPDTVANEVKLCQTGHANVHRLLSVYEATGQTPPWVIRRSFGPGERALAAKGWAEFQAAGG